MDNTEKELLKTIADMEGAPEGAYNIRANGELAARATTANVNIVSKTDKPGIDIIVAENTKGESVHIPVIVNATGFSDLVYNDFYIGKNADVTIIAGCGINNCGGEESRHDGIHTFHVAPNARVKYIEKHYGEGSGCGERNMNPTTVIYLEEGAYMEMETTQIGGIDSTKRLTTATAAKNATIVVHEKIMTHKDQHAETDFTVDLNGENSGANVISRSVARDNSVQTFRSDMHGNNMCNGHTECDAIIMDEAKVNAIPQLSANDINASLIHEAAIGRIAGEQLTKLMTLGLTEKQAETEIVNGFLK